MASDGNSFLPRILSVFYAIFDTKEGQKVLYQVPEGLIGPHTTLPASFASPSTSSLTRESISGNLSRASSISARSRRRDLDIQPRNSSSTSGVLFDFEDISRYVIPPSQLCGRLVVCSTKKYRIIGFPVEIYGDHYDRNYFRFNIAFVFERRADLSCFESVVRKIARVLTHCEEESAFLSSPATSPTMHTILEQLYEDLNSYAETSIPIDRHNSIELKVFPFYPNPPRVQDWMVPVALINLNRRREANWDLVMSAVCRYVDGTNHVSRIAHLANCDIALTRKAIEHLLYYQVIMMIDIFQYSNIYTLNRSISWLADESHVRDECGPYVTKPDHAMPDWPKLLYLYSRLKPEITVFEWMQEYDVHSLGIDPRRFTSFGVIKGFLRRVHRWPVFFHEKERPERRLSVGRRRGKSFSNTIGPSLSRLEPSTGSIQFSPPASSASQAGQSPEGAQVLVSPTRRASAAEYLEQYRKEIESTPDAADRSNTTSSPRISRILRAHASAPQDSHRRHSMQSPTSLLNTHGHNFTSPIPPSLSALFSTPDPTESTPPSATKLRPSLSRSPSSFPNNSSSNVVAGPQEYPPDLKGLLDGTHHTDELGVKFEAGWPLLEQYLVAIGGGSGDGDYGQVEIIYH